MRFARFLPVLVLLAACSPEASTPAATVEDEIPADDGSEVEELRQIPDAWDVVLLPAGLVGLKVNSRGLVVARREGQNLMYNYRNGREWALPQGEVVAINDHEQVLLNREGRAYLWSKTGIVELGSVKGGATSAVDLNNAGHVVGNSGGKPFLWTPAKRMRPLWGRGAPDVALAMNGKDHVAGTRGSEIVVWNPAGSTKAVISGPLASCPPPFSDPAATCGLGILGLDNRGTIGGIVGSSSNGGPSNTAGFVLHQSGDLLAFHGVGNSTTPTGYTDSGIMPMLSFLSTVASVRLPDGRIRNLFVELGGIGYAVAAGMDGHILGQTYSFPNSEFRFAVLVPRPAR